MIRIQADKANATVTESETLTKGSVGIECAFTFSDDWNGLARFGVFEGAETKVIVLGNTNECAVPAECLAEAGYRLRIGACGIAPDGSLVIPTVWAKVGKIVDSATLPDEETEQFTPAVVAQIEEKADAALQLAQRVATQADAGEFDGADGEGVPAGGSSLQYLRKATGTDYDTEWATMPADEVFWATKDTTTSAQIEAAYQAGKECLVLYSDRVYQLTNRASNTKHIFSCPVANIMYTLTCTSDSWSATNSPLALSANVPGAATDNPADLGTAAKGSSAKYARQDHVHKMPSASDVGAIAAPDSANDDDVLTYDDGAWVAKPGGGGGGVTVDDELSDSSTNPVQNKVIKAALDGKGTYSKPSGGIPASDLASAVQTSLGKADTALQSAPVTSVNGQTGAVSLSIPSSASDVGAEPAVTEETVSTAGSVTKALDAGKIYHFTGALTALTITLNAAAAGQIAHYHFDFNCGSTAPTVTIPNTVAMPSGSFEASKHYEVDILNNYGAVMAWATS